MREMSLFPSRIGLVLFLSILVLCFGCRAATPVPDGEPGEGYTAYRSGVYGWGFECPVDWGIREPSMRTGQLGRAWEGTALDSTTYALDQQAYGHYVVEMLVAPAVAGTLTETMAVELAPMVEWARAAVSTSCCARMAGEDALTIVYGSPIARQGRREVAVLRSGYEYRLSITPDPLRFSSPSDLAVWEAYEHLMVSLNLSDKPLAAGASTPMVSPAPTPSSPP